MYHKACTRCRLIAANSVASMSVVCYKAKPEVERRDAALKQFKLFTGTAVVPPAMSAKREHDTESRAG